MRRGNYQAGLANAGRDCPETENVLASFERNALTEAMARFRCLGAGHGRTREGPVGRLSREKAPEEACAILIGIARCAHACVGAPEQGAQSAQQQDGCYEGYETHRMTPNIRHP